MTSADRHLDRRGRARHDAGHPTSGSIDFPFLDSQTDGDRALQDEVLELFLAQARRLVPTLPTLSTKEQDDVAHLLKGSARGIGAWAIAEETAAYEAADGAARPALFHRIAAAFARVEADIAARLSDAPPAGSRPTATI